MILTTRNPFQVLGSVVGLHAILMVHLQPFSPTFHKGDGHKGMDAIYSSLTFIPKPNLQIAISPFPWPEHLFRVRIAHTALIAHFVSGIRHFTLVPNFICHSKNF